MRRVVRDLREIVDKLVNGLFEYENKKVVRLIRMNGFYPEHKINFEQDYSSLKRFTIRFKEQNVLMDWVKKQIPETFVKIGEDYKDCKFDLNWENN